MWIESQDKRWLLNADNVQGIEIDIEQADGVYIWAYVAGFADRVKLFYAPASEHGHATKGMTYLVNSIANQEAICNLSRDFR